MRRPRGAIEWVGKRSAPSIFMNPCEWAHVTLTHLGASAWAATPDEWVAGRAVCVAFTPAQGDRTFTAYARGGESALCWGRQSPSRDGRRRGRSMTGWPQNRNSCGPVHGLASCGGPEGSQGVGGHRQAVERDHIASSVPSTSGCIRRVRAHAQRSTAIAMRREQSVARCCSARDPVRASR